MAKLSQSFSPGLHNPSQGSPISNDSNRSSEDPQFEKPWTEDMDFSLVYQAQPEDLLPGTAKLKSAGFQGAGLRI